MKCLLLDTETTGLRPDRHCVIQVAGRIAQNDSKIKDFSFLLKPRKGAKIDPKALELSGITSKDLKSDDRLHYKDGFFRFKSLLQRYVNPFDRTDKFHLFAFNGRFDEDFLRAFWNDNDDPYFGSFFHAPCHCVWDMATLYPPIFERRPKMPDVKLATIAAELGIYVDKTKLHDASYDVSLTTQILFKICPAFDFRLPEEKS